MKIGLRLPQTGKDHATKENIVHLAKEAENAGLDSLWVLERLVWPINPQNPYPGTRDGRFPDDWQYILDPIETLVFAAANTKKIALGTSVIDMLFHNPVILARRFATLDVLSKGRAIAGLGIGWSRDEYEVSGIPFKDRGKRADEYIQILKQIWTAFKMSVQKGFGGDLIESKDTTLGGNPAHMVTEEMNPKFADSKMGSNVKALEIWTIGNEGDNRWYDIIFMAPADKYDQYLPIVQKMSNSFQFTK